MGQRHTTFMDWQRCIHDVLRQISMCEADAPLNRFQHASEVEDGCRRYGRFSDFRCHDELQVQSLTEGRGSLAGVQATEFVQLQYDTGDAARSFVSNVR
ncbi:MAG: hypothetical protein JWM36_108 [Hyphomicrobiales bacterium]|nr:hypothetical protein [Hyphomicrobiales bacterium]